MNGFGRQYGPLRLDYGPEWSDLKCDQCGATWVGIIDEPCGWCDAALERMTRWQAELVIQRPDVDPEDSRYNTAMRAWAARMATAVTAGIITKRQADNAWLRGRNGPSREHHAA